MVFSILLLLSRLSCKSLLRKSAPKTLTHGAGQIGLLAALALLGRLFHFVLLRYRRDDECVASYGLQKHAYIVVE
jgi:hypothetical protein